MTVSVTTTVEAEGPDVVGQVRVDLVEHEDVDEARVEACDAERARLVAERDAASGRPAL